MSKVSMERVLPLHRQLLGDCVGAARNTEDYIAELKGMLDKFVARETPKADLQPKLRAWPEIAAPKTLSSMA